MKPILLLFVSLTLVLHVPLKAQTYYHHSNLHLTFTIDKDKKEAMLGTGKDMTMANAIYRPPIGDDYWDNPTNLWENIDIPEQINYQGEDYKVTSIAPYAFYQSTEVKNISLPQTIRSMGTNAFYWCVNLTTVNIPDGITKIEANTF